MFSKSIGMAHMGVEHDVPDPAAPTRKLLICTAPRTASGSLSTLIRASGQSGLASPENCLTAPIWFSCFGVTSVTRRFPIPCPS
jgi:hypothetical protein